MYKRQHLLQSTQTGHHRQQQLPVLFPNDRRAEVKVHCHSSTLHLGIAHLYRSPSNPVTQEWLTNSQLANGNVRHE